MQEINPVDVWDDGFEHGVLDDYSTPPYAEVAMRRLWQLGWMSARKIQALFDGKVSEHTHQVALIRWAKAAELLRPELKLLFAVPNGGMRHPIVAAQLKEEGVKAGVPDLILPIPRYGSGALYIEMKMPKGRVSPEQAIWLQDLEDNGNTSLACFGWHEARQAVKDYLSGEKDD
jgi:hypothetical protein